MSESAHTGPLCPQCGSVSVGDVWWEDGNGTEVDVPASHDPGEHPELVKMVARECVSCGVYWEYEVA